MIVDRLLKLVNYRGDNGSRLSLVYFQHTRGGMIRPRSDDCVNTIDRTGLFVSPLSDSDPGFVVQRFLQVGVLIAGCGVNVKRQ